MLLLTGATGNIGRELTRTLTASNTEFRVLIRDPARAAHLPDHVERHLGDLDDPNALSEAMTGASALFLLVPGTGLDHTHHAIKAAQEAGVGRIVLISSLWTLGDPVPAMGRWHLERERLLTESGIPHTVIRPGGLMSNVLEWAPAIRAGEVLVDPTGPGRFFPVDPADIAAVAALALTSDGHDNATYLLTGQDSFTFAEQIATLSRELNRDIAFRTAASAAEAVAARFPNGAPPTLSAAILESFTAMRADTVGLHTNTVTELLGRPPRSFAQWCAAHRTTFAD
ncbi:SDR family oxidoreductase [Nocardia sp. NBC_00511]|uniref:SDR family oxidoreductase n=1 Tax=Nocardia sp. NBC_00511 TaxID=2903591 RepID=UPI0030DF384C